MSSPAHAASLREDAGSLNDLRSRYEAAGYRFVLEPDESLLPPFLGSYRPDALAQKPGLNIAIEIKRGPPSSSTSKLRNIRRLFEGHPDWQFNVFHGGSNPSTVVPIPAPSPESLKAAMGEVRALLDQGHRRPAFVLGWSLLEAVSHRQAEDPTNGPRTPGTIVQTLAMDGLIGPDVERRLRTLIALRNRIVHGDLTAKPTEAEMALLTDAIEEALAGES